VTRLRWSYAALAGLAVAVVTVAWFTDQRYVQDRTNLALLSADRAQLVARAALDRHGPIDLGARGLSAGATALTGTVDVVDEVKRLTGFGCTLFQGGKRVSTTATARDSTERAIGTMAAADVIEHVLENGGTFRGITHTIGKDWVIVYSPLRAPSGDVVGMLATFRERGAFLSGLREFRVTLWVTLGALLIIVSGLVWRWRYEHQLAAANQGKAEAAALRSQFYASLSHELRTPLVAIANLTYQIDDDVGGVIRSEANELLGLINNVLDASKLEAGNVELDLEDVDLRELVDRVLLRARSLLEEKPIELRAEIPDGVGTVNADFVKLKQVLTNLVANAIKFTESGEVTVRVVEGDDALELVVEDTGIGIPPEHIATIFEPFRQANAGIQRAYGGTGLGLAIAKGICDAHGGSIHVESTPGQGSRFCARLPRTPGAAPAPVAAPQPVPGNA